jgi:CBS domain containing-hemolysin-like protein
MTGPDGRQIPPTNKSFEVDFCTVAHWQNGQIVEENFEVMDMDGHRVDKVLATPLRPS